MNSEALLALHPTTGKYVPSFSEVAAPLNALTQKETPYNWNSDCQSAFETLKEALVSAPVFALPREGCQVILDTEKVLLYIQGALGNSQNG